MDPGERRRIHSSTCYAWYACGTAAPRAGACAGRAMALPGESVDARAGGLYHLCHFHEIGAQQRVERLGTERLRLDALLRQPVEDHRVLEQDSDRDVDSLQRRARNPAGPSKPSQESNS